MISRKHGAHGQFVSVPLEERFWANVEKSAGCWHWRGNSNGRYGTIGVGEKNRLVHRVAYELFVGPIPEGLTIDHLCRNKLCVNPAHLEPVTGQENQRRGYSHITHCPKGHAYTADNQLTRHGKARRECRQCNREAALRRYHAKKMVLDG